MPAEPLRITDPKKWAKMELYVNHLNQEVKRLSILNNNEIRLKACSELAHIFYHGAVMEAHLQEDPRVIDILLSIVLNVREIPALRIQGLQTISTLCLQTEPIRLLLIARKAVLLLCRLFQDSNSMIRKWAVHCVFLLIIKHHRKYTSMLKGEILFDHLTSIAMEDWSQFRHNDAERFLALLKEMNPPKPLQTLSRRATQISAD
ncbi:hypothetical protein BCR33DRAFT_712732 [Rhizoclosmatium globosum]|uniref:Uncharacterized protein n=1 Tax=Rhizoclosmatium globosum TaxID=329046 RepID=A0A1Y2CUP4_9FUNG|nr:hypothetical protein BCR33DRAFT_712732 [Rhizoclosmatium globosum]|eukprot:ORY50732.1 hypothetical protein BCR33DRAFT_712732 [Rhizoclosmatium globosum]